MKSFDTEFKKYADKVSLKAAERRELRERVLSYMEYHPLPKQERVSSELSQALISEAFVRLHISPRILRIASGVFALIVIVVPFVAERAVPGDVLYLVKTGINESIQGQLVSSPYEKIEFETRLMERRISEARVLADEGRLTDEVKAEIVETVKGHSDAVQSGLAELRTQDADEAAIAQIGFSSSLEVQTAVLETNENHENASSIEAILTAVNEAHEEVNADRGTSSPSFNGLRARVERETTRAYELFESVKQSATPEEIADIERRISDSDRMVKEAEAKLTVDAQAAGDDLTTALKLIQKLVLFMTNIDIRESIALETIVPVSLSDVERTELVKEELRFVDGIRREVATSILLVTEEGVVEKATEGLVTVDQLVLKASTALDVSDVKSAETAIAEARTLIVDIKAILTQVLPETLPPTEEPVVEEVPVEGTETPVEEVKKPEEGR